MNNKTSGTPDGKKETPLLDISSKTFIEVCCLLFGLLIVSIILTYIIPRGAFGVLPDGSTDYLSYTRRDDLSGIPLLQGIFAPVLVFFSSDGLSLIMLSLFLFVISAAFQVMNDLSGIRVLVSAVSRRFRNRETLLLCLLAFLFYSFGAFLGLFEEMLTMLPVVASLCLLMGYDSFTGFITCILACGFGFASAITNPFTVLLASEIIGVNPMVHVWYRLVIFAVMFLLLLGFLVLHLRKLRKDPSSSPTRAHDERLRAAEGGTSGSAAPELDGPQEKKLLLVYSVFLITALVLIIAVSLSDAARGYTVPILTAYFLIFGIAAGALASGDLKRVLKSFGKGLLGALPTIAFIALAASVKFVFERGSVLPTIVQAINNVASGKNIYLVALLIWLIVLALEFFISSSTAKAILVMGILAVVNIGLSKEMLVLLYTFADGYTNVLFPTSPVLLISLSMLEMDYFSWLKRSWRLFLVNALLVAAFIILGIVIAY